MGAGELEVRGGRCRDSGHIGGSAALRQKKERKSGGRERETC